MAPATLESISKAAASKITTEDNGPVNTLYVAAITSSAFMVLFLCARLYSRSYPTLRPWWDDGLLVISAVRCSNISNVGRMLIKELVPGSGERSLNHQDCQHGCALSNTVLGIPLINSALKTAFWCYMIPLVANCLIKIAVCLMLLRIKDGFRWRLMLWSLIAMCGAVAIISVLTIILSCSPVSAYWDVIARYTGKSCWPVEISIFITYGTGGMLLVLNAMQI
jgi:hypothetical protein